MLLSDQNCIINVCYLSIHFAVIIVLLIRLDDHEEPECGLFIEKMSTNPLLRLSNDRLWKEPNPVYQYFYSIDQSLIDK